MLLIFIIINLIINLAFLTAFELKKPSVKEFIPLAVICAAAALGRLIFSFIPQVQPVTVLVIITGSAYGASYGYVTGALCALISNMLLGQGPWTLFQMTAWGTIGLIAGLLGRPFSKMQKSLQKNGKDSRLEPVLFAVYGFFSAFIFSIITDLLTVAYIDKAVSAASVTAIFVTGIVFNISHAIFNALLLLMIYAPVRRKLLRCR